MRLGVYGGTFDPVHYAHLLLAEQCREQLHLDEVWFIPAAVNPHKLEVAASSPRDRLAMLRLATAGIPGFVVSEMEISRGGVSFTVDTLSELKAADPSRELYLLMGADSLADLPRWREPARILELARIVAVNRGEHLPPLDLTAQELAASGLALEGRVTQALMPAVNLSATDIRLRAGAGRSVRFMTPPAVERYLAEHKLYRD